MGDAYNKSLADGPHALIAQLVGEYTGTARTWFEPDVLVDTAPVSGTIRSVLGGRYAVHEYESTLEGTAYSGLAIIGFDMQLNSFVVAWVDSFHTATGILSSCGDGGQTGVLSVTGAYRDPSGGPDWGWRTDFAWPEPGRLLITHYNIEPGGEPTKAVEFDYHRQEPG